MQRHRSLRTVLGNDESAARRIDVLVALGQPEPDLERRVLERERELVAQITRDVSSRWTTSSPTWTRASRARSSPQRSASGSAVSASDLPPEEIDREARRSRGEREDAVEHGPERRDDRSKQQRPEDAPRTRRRPHELPRDEHDERRREHAVRRHRVGVLQEGDDAVVAADGDQALARDRIEVAELLAPVVEQQDRERERDRDAVRDSEEGRSSRSVTRPDGYASATCATSA